MQINKLFAGVAVVSALSAAPAMAQNTILSFGFTDMAGSYSTGSNTFMAQAVDLAPLRTSGDVTRLINPDAGTALYSPGAAAGLASVNLLVSGIVGSTANGNGTLTLLDADGDTLTATINGQFIANGPAVFFNGVLSNIAFADGGVPDTTWNGPSGGSFLRSFQPAPPPYTGALVQLFIGNAGGFFTQNFERVSTQVSGAIVPAPASLGLLGFGMALAGRRRRR